MKVLAMEEEWIYMRSLNKNEFIEKVEIRPENILEGFNNYNNANF